MAGHKVVLRPAATPTRTQRRLCPPSPVGVSYGHRLLPLIAAALLLLAPACGDDVDDVDAGRPCRADCECGPAESCRDQRCELTGALDYGVCHPGPVVFEWTCPCIGGTCDESWCCVLPDGTVDDGFGPACFPPANGDCDLVAQTGCAVGQKCGIILFSTEPYLAHYDCTPDGSVSLGGDCTVPTATGEADDCAGPGFCYEGVCREMCDTRCSDAPWTTCRVVLPVNFNFFVCLPGCHPLQQDCADGDACILTAAGTTCASVESPGLQGSPCTPVTTFSGCDPGFGCIGESKQSGVCRAFCDFSANPDAADPIYCQPAEVCAAIPDVNDIGQCI